MCAVVGVDVVLDAWVAAEPTITWVRPRAGTIALLKYGPDMPSEPFSMRLVEEAGAMFTPGSAFDVEGTVRIGYAPRLSSPTDCRPCPPLSAATRRLAVAPDDGPVLLNAQAADGGPRARRRAGVS